MSSDASDKRRRILEEKRAANLENLLRKSRIIRFHGDEEIPTWIHSELVRMRKMGSSPQEYISCDAERAELLEWMMAFLEKSGIRGFFRISTGIQSKPWAELQALIDDWLDEFTEHCGHDLYIVSHNLRDLVVFFEEEYRYEAFHATLTPEDRRNEEP